MGPPRLAGLQVDEVDTSGPAANRLLAGDDHLVGPLVGGGQKGLDAAAQSLDVRARLGQSRLQGPLPRNGGKGLLEAHAHVEQVPKLGQLRDDALGLLPVRGLGAEPDPSVLLQPPVANRPALAIRRLHLLPAVRDQQVAGRLNHAVAGYPEHAAPAAGGHAPVLLLEQAARVAQEAVGQHRPRPADRMVLLEVIVGQLTVGAAESGGHRAAGRYEQVLLGCQQVALGGWAASGVGPAVRLRHLQAPGAVIGPDGLAASGVQRVEVDAVAGPDAGGEVDVVVQHHGAAPGGPARDQPPAPQALAVVRAPAVLPQQLPVGQRQRVEPAVVAGHEDAITPDGRGEADRPLAEERPSGPAGGQVQRDHLVVGRGAEDHKTGRHDRLVRPIEVHPIRGRPGGPGRRFRPIDPARLQLLRQALGRVAAPRCVGPIRGPVGRPAHGQGKEAANRCG